MPSCSFLVTLNTEVAQKAPSLKSPASWGTGGMYGFRLQKWGNLITFSIGSLFTVRCLSIGEVTAVSYPIGQSQSMWDDVISEIHLIPINLKRAVNFWPITADDSSNTVAQQAASLANLFVLVTDHCRCLMIQQKQFHLICEQVDLLARILTLACTFVQSWQVFDEWLLDVDISLNAGNWMWLSASDFFHHYFRVYSPIAFEKKTDKKISSGNSWSEQRKLYLYGTWSCDV